MNKTVAKGEERRQGLWQGWWEKKRGKKCRNDRQKLKGTISEERARGDKGKDSSSKWDVRRRCCGRH